jgi:hypothetical protein
MRLSSHFIKAIKASKMFIHYCPLLFAACKALQITKRRVSLCPKRLLIAGVISVIIGVCASGQLTVSCSTAIAAFFCCHEKAGSR